MSEAASLVVKLTATLTVSLECDSATTVLHSLQDDALAPNGMFLNGGLEHFGVESNLAPRISGLITRSDGTDVKESDVTLVRQWLTTNPQVSEVTIGELKPCNSQEFMPIGSEESDV